MTDRDQEAERSRLSDVRRLRSPLMPGWSPVGPGRMQVPMITHIC